MHPPATFSKEKSMNNVLKNRLIRLVPVILLVSSLFLFKSCELEKCMICKIEKYDKGGNKIEDVTEPVEYCGAELDEIREMDDEDIGDYITKWECN